MLKKNTFNAKNKGFSLVEMSVVIVITSLIVAGTVSAKNIIYSAKIRTVLSEYQSHETAIKSFKDIFHKLPGDMDNAYSYWGAECDSIASNCNGNNNSVVNWNANSSGGKSRDNETHRAWQHLYLAGMLETPFTGKVLGGDGDTAFATNTEMYFSQTGWGKYFIDGTYKLFNSESPSNYIILGSLDQNIWYPMFSVKDAHNIDRKIDDGIANDGKLFSLTGGYTNPNTNCSQSWRTNTSGENYNFSNLDSEVKYCIIAYLLDI